MQIDRQTYRQSESSFFHLGYSLDSMLLLTHSPTIGGIHPPGRGIVGKYRNARRKFKKVFIFWAEPMCFQNSLHVLVVYTVKRLYRQWESQILWHHKCGYADFLFHLNLLTSYSFCLQGDNFKLFAEVFANYRVLFRSKTELNYMGYHYKLLFALFYRNNRLTKK